TDGAARVLVSELFRHPRIGTCFAHRNGTQNFPGPQLKVRPDWRQSNVELQFPSRKIIGQLPADRLQMWVLARHDVRPQTLSQNRQFPSRCPPIDELEQA